MAVGDEFLLGTFSFINGDWFGDLPDSEFSFRLVTSSTDSALHDHTFAGTLGFHVTSRCSNGVCSSDPAMDADQFYIKERPDLGRVTVLELNAQPGVPNSGTVSLYGRIGSLIPTRFADATGGVVLLPAAQPVPEPGAWALCLLGLGLMSHVFARKLRQPAR